MSKLSVALCTYNGERYLREQLESIAAQTRPPDELVVCDDRSGDATPQLVEAFAATAPFQVRLHVNEQNLGSTKNFERAISLCAGEIIALSDQDDVWCGEKLARLEAVFAAAPDAGLVFSDGEVVDEALRPLGRRLWESVGFDRAQQKLLTQGRSLDVLLTGWTVTGATMAFRAKFRDLMLPIPTDVPMIHDGWIALMIATVARVAFISEPLIKYRQHPRQQVGAPEKKGPAGADSPQLLNAAAIQSALERSNSYDELIGIILKVRQRLAEQGDSFERRESPAKMESRMAHLQARANLPEGRLRRAPRVVRELLTRRYHLYSKGIYSAAKDLFSGSAARPPR